MMSFCQNCGAPLTPGIRFCPKCGAAVAPETNQTVPPAADYQESGYQPPRPAGGRNNNPLIIGLLAAIVLLLGCGIGYYIYSNAAARNAAQDANSQATTEKKPAEETKPAPAQDQDKKPAQTTKAAAAPSGSSLDDFVREKDAIDTAIGETANQINAHLQTHASFRGYYQIKNEAQNLEERANQARNRLNGTAAADAGKKQALLHLFDLEAARAHGLYKGIVDNQNGGDYSYGFQQGTKASDAFDSANANFNASY